jgi:hypothetical protein
VSTENREEWLHELAEQVEALSSAVEKLRGGRVNEKAIVVLLKWVTGMPMYEIKRVLDALEDLPSLVLKYEEELE